MLVDPSPLCVWCGEPMIVDREYREDLGRQVVNEDGHYTTDAYFVRCTKSGCECRGPVRGSESMAVAAYLLVAQHLFNPKGIDAS